MFSAWWCAGAIFLNLIESGSSIVVEFYTSQLNGVQTDLRQNRFRQLCWSDIILEKDVDIPHVANRILQQKIGELGWERRNPPPYSADREPSANFFVRYGTPWL